jgi:Fic family protein
MQRPYSITPRIVELVAAISERIGEIKANHLEMPPAEVRKLNRIKTIQSSLGIDGGNVLSSDQIKAILDNKPVIGASSGIPEVRNALEVYDRLDQFKPTSLSSLLRAHKLMMSGLMDSPGRLRTKDVDLVRRKGVAYFPLGGNMVRQFVESLFGYLKDSEDLALIKSCVFHYQLDLIQPFAMGNGRMGRLWQTIILMEHYPVMAFLPVEAIVWREEEGYFGALDSGNDSGGSTGFIEFMLGAILEALEDLLSGRFLSLTAAERVERFRGEIGKRSFSRKEYLGKYKNISTATASRDLRDGVKRKVLKRTGDKRNSIYRFVAA